MLYIMLLLRYKNWYRLIFGLICPVKALIFMG